MKKIGKIIKCLNCNKDIYVVPSQERGRNIKKFCSRKCANEHPSKKITALRNLTSINNIGRNNPRYKDGRWIYRKRILSERENICEVCGINTKLLVHHIDGNRGNNIGNNLIILCGSCHSLVHKISPKTTDERNKIQYLANKLFIFTK